MASDLALRNTQLAKPNVDLSVIGTNDVYDMIATFGAASDTAIVNTVASGTEIIFTKTAGGLTICWVSGRVPAGGFTLTSTFLSIWARESNMNANCGGRFRVFKYTPGSPPTLTELGGGPFNDGVEFTTADAEYTWTGNVTDQAFAENDRIVVKIYITNIGTMGGGFTCTLTFNAASASTGDSFFQIAENVTFKSEPVDFVLTADPGSYALTGAAATIVANRMVTADPGSYLVTGLSATLQLERTVIADPGSYAVTGAAATIVAGRMVTADPGSYIVTGQAATLQLERTIIADPGAYVVTGADASLITSRLLSADPGAYVLSGAAASLLADRIITADAGVYVIVGSAAGLIADKILSADPGAYILTGSAAAIVAGRMLSAGVGVYVLTGFAADLIYVGGGAFSLIAEPGAYLLNGSNAQLVAGRILNAEPGSYIVSGLDAVLVVTPPIVANDYVSVPMRQFVFTPE